MTPRSLSSIKFLYRRPIYRSKQNNILLQAIIYTLIMGWDSKLRVAFLCYFNLNLKHDRKPGIIRFTRSKRPDVSSFYRAPRNERENSNTQNYSVGGIILRSQLLAQSVRLKLSIFFSILQL